MRKFKRMASRAVAFSMATMMMITGGLGNFGLAGRNTFGTDEVLANTTTGTVDADKFSWDNATVYFLLTDRFKNGNTSNDHSYNRGLDKDGNVINVSDDRATFHGGDFAGITQAIEEGYFEDLGVNALWISAAYEQIHGYVVGDDSAPSFAHYSYHGYYVLDYTQTDANFGTEEEFKTLVDTAHEHGIRVVMDVVMNHAGYNSLYDMKEYGFGTVKEGWDDYYYSMANVNNTKYHSYIDYESSDDDWGNWWGSDWVRCGMPGYTAGGGDNYTMSLAGLPDFKTESTKEVGIPEFLAKKWKQEGRYEQEVNELKSYLNANGYEMTVTNCISYWLSSWVREYGVDGFRCDTAKHVELSSWKTLNDMCTEALKTWRVNNPTAPGADWTDDFWMTGESWDHGVSYDDYYTKGGFDSMINFETQGAGVLALNTVADKYNEYAAAINTNDDFNVLSFISSHDDVLAGGNSIYTGSAFLLLPGAVQIYYGDETKRGLVPGIRFDGNGGAGHALRSDMNWDTMEEDTLAHWQKVGIFRNNHIAVGAGDNRKVTTSSGVGFVRTYSKNGVSDRIAACIGADANTNVTIDVSAAWKPGDVVVNYYDSSSAVVAENGMVTFNSGANGTILVGDSDGRPLVSVTADAKFKGTTTATINIDGADYAIVSVDGGKKFIAHDEDTFTIGETAYEGDTITVTYKATNEKGTSNSKATFYKGYANEDFTGGGEEEPAKNTITIRVKPYSGFSGDLYLYVWSDDNKISGAWPGKQLTEKDKNGNYVFTVEGYKTVNCILNGGLGAAQTGDITGITGEVLLTMGDGINVTVEEIVKAESEFSLMKQAARSIKNLVKEDFTSESYDKLYAYVEPADALIAQGEEQADKDAVHTMYSDIMAAQAALVLAVPEVQTASVGSKTVSGTAPCEADVTVTIDGKVYTAVADEVTGQWSVTADRNLTNSSVITTECARNSLKSHTREYILSGGGGSGSGDDSSSGSSSGDGSSSGSSSGDGSSSGGSSSNVSSSGGSTSEVNTGKDSGSDVTTTTSPTEVKVENGTASATVKAENVTEAIKQAADNRSAEIVFTVSAEEAGNADKIQLTMTKSDVQQILDKTDADLVVATKAGNVILPQEALKETVSAAGGNDITIEIDKVTTPTDVQKEAVGENGYIVEVTIASQNKAITSFGENTLKIRLEVPASLAGKDVAVIYIAEDGKTEKMPGKIVTEGTKQYYEFTTTHLSTFALVESSTIKEKTPTVTAPKKGTLLTDSKTKMVYKVTKSGTTSGTVQFVKTTDTKGKTIAIPDKVTIDGITYKVTSIAANALKDNKTVTTVTIGKYVTFIGSGAFSGCTRLKKVTIGKSVTTIDFKAFYKCTSLTSIMIPSKVTKIGNYAFKGCAKLKTIKLSTTFLTTETVSDKAFSGVSTSAVVKVPKSKAKTYKKLLVKKGLSKKVTIKNL